MFAQYDLFSSIRKRFNLRDELPDTQIRKKLQIKLFNNWRWVHENYQKTFEKWGKSYTYGDNASNKAIVPLFLKEEKYYGDRKGKSAGS